MLLSKVDESVLLLQEKSKDQDVEELRNKWMAGNALIRYYIYIVLLNAVLSWISTGGCVSGRLFYYVKSGKNVILEKPFISWLGAKFIIILEAQCMKTDVSPSAEQMYLENFSEHGCCIFTKLLTQETNK